MAEPTPETSASASSSIAAPFEPNVGFTPAPFLLPLPIAFLDGSQNPSSGSRPEERLVSLNLPPEIASADISVCANGAFLETSSGAAAREVKRVLDEHIGVEKGRRSPYIITAVINQFGKQMFRIGNPDITKPKTGTDDHDLPPAGAAGLTSAGHSRSYHLPHSSRRPRMSVHSFLPPTVRKNGSTSSQQPPPFSPQHHHNHSQHHSTVHKTFIDDVSRSPPARKLRKTRSIPNNISGATTGGDHNAPNSAVPSKPSTPTGRPHAHSVSSADAYRSPFPPPTQPPVPKAPVPDIFSQVLNRESVPPSPYGSHSSKAASKAPYNLANESTPDVIVNPFGPGVSFDSPTWRSSPSYLTSPPVLREMQSFESGLTARADPPLRGSRLGKLRTRQSTDTLPSSEPVSPAIPSPSQPETPTTYKAASEESLFPLRYPTELFDVLQNSRGLPALDKLDAAVSSSQEKTIKLSLKADETAAPRDDPRFVIWGEVEVDGDELDEQSLSRGSFTDFSSGHHSGVSRRKSGKRHTIAVPDTPLLRVPSGEGPKKVLVAATIERWIAQLTSELNYDELLIFFLTYRTYVSAVDLGHLLICRFHWALGQPTSAHDEMVKRIVRVRTFIAIRYWLLTFFSVDFVPNRDLRLLFADWLNTLKKDPILNRHRDAVAIVQKLRKVAWDCKEAHTRKGKPSGRHSTDRDKQRQYVLPSLGDLSNGHFAKSLRKAVSPEEYDPDDDIDLDFDGLGAQDAQDFRLAAQSMAKNPNTSVDLAMLRQPLHFAYLQNNVTAKAVDMSPVVPVPVPLSVPHSTVSRVLVHAMGTLGRWKRVLNSRSPVRAPVKGTTNATDANVDVSAFDIEANDLGDMLHVHGGVEQYLKMVETQVAQARALLEDQVERPSTSPPSISTSLDSSSSTKISSVRSTVQVDDETKHIDDLEPLTEKTEESASVRSPTLAATPSASNADIPDLSHDTSFSQSDSLASDMSTTDRWDVPPHWQPDVVSIDDLDLSDLSSDENADLRQPAGLRKPQRRLPNRRDFEFLRRSIDSVSSMGIQTRDSVTSTESVSVVSSGGNGELGGAIQQWQMNALIDSLSDEEEDGDVEAALRRLEGQINQDKQRLKQSKVDGWVQSIRERLAQGQFGERDKDSSEEEDYGEVRNTSDRPGSPSSVSRVSSSHPSRRSSIADPPVPPGLEDVNAESPQSPPTQQIPLCAASPEAKPAVEDAVPTEILQSRVPSRPGTSAGPSSNRQATGLSLTANPSKIFSDKHNWHRSFVLEFSSETLMQHFSMIDRELFLALKFEELVSRDWVASGDHANILDWSEFLRERARLRAEGRSGWKTSAVTLVRGRFNLVANFVTSEIVLTHPSQRAALFAKFVRLAWKAYSMMNFNMLVAILAGLNSDWVAKAMKKFPRLGMETRMFNDLNRWITPEGHFKHIRHSVDNLAKAKPLNGGQDPSTVSMDGQSSTGRGRATSDTKPPPPSACIPFLGIYLSYLFKYNTLPDLIDPTAPNEPVTVNPSTNTFEAPAHPEVFSTLAPLPPSVQLEPLINVHKQRLIADVVKSLTAGQHLASRVQYPIDKKLYQRCLKLRGLDSETLERALSLYSSDKS
ncbi:ras GEF [Panus rudis PR-1116 ss-1]|nr:ras GEF [Panus rudis PR-1116 ss-1]